MPDYRKPASFKSAAAFREHLAALGADLPCDDAPLAAPESPLAQSINVDRFTIGNRSTIGNRFCILPMEGWDGTPDGRPSALTVRRWQRFGCSGAKLIWGGEATAVRQDGRANPNQLMINRDTLPDLIHLREELVAAHREAAGETSDLCIGLQLTHSGRYARPNQKTRLEPMIAYDHPLLNPRAGLEQRSGRVLSDDQIHEIMEDVINAAGLAQEAGFDFVDVKLCHGYLGHELLSAVERPGPFGGSLENRTRFPREIIQGIQHRFPGMAVGVRLSAFDFVPFRPGPDRVGIPDFGPLAGGLYPYAFGGDGTGLGIDLSESIELIRMLNGLGVRLICITGGSPYYVPHIQRPAYFPPSDGYLPPEDPLIGVARQLAAARQIKAACPDAVVVGSACSALQDWLPNVLQAVVRAGWVDFAGLGRSALSYPALPVDVLAGRPLQRKRICRTFSDCTSAPRGGLVSGCYPLDEMYKESPEAEALKEMKKGG